MERKYANSNNKQIFTSRLYNNNDLEDGAGGGSGYLGRHPTDNGGLTTGVSKVRRMARALEENCGDLSGRMGNAAREMFARTAPRSLDQLARFNSVADLSRCSQNANFLKPLVNLSAEAARKQHAHLRKCDLSMDVPYACPAETSSATTMKDPAHCDEPIHLRPYVIIKETIRCSPAPLPPNAPPRENECYAKPAAGRVMLHTLPSNGEEINRGGQYPHHKHVRFRPAFEHSVSYGSCWDGGDTAKYCSSAASFATEKALTFDHILLRKSSDSPPSADDQPQPQEGRSGSAGHLYAAAYRKSIQDNCSSESGYLSDCSLLYSRPEQHTADSAILIANSATAAGSCFQPKPCATAAADLPTIQNKRCTRDYSPPGSTASSMNSAGSAPASCRQTRVKGQAVLFAQLSLDSTLESYYTSPTVNLGGIPGFARHTEASKRRSKKQSASIPSSLNNQSPLSSSMTWCNQHRGDQSDESPNTTAMASQRIPGQASRSLAKQPADVVAENVLRKEWEPQGQYHVFKKWCDSLRKYEGKNKPHHLNNVSTSRSPNNRRSLVECAGNIPPPLRHSPKQSNDKQLNPEFNVAAQQSALTQNLIKNEKNAFSDKTLQQVGGALSKAVSLDCVCAETRVATEYKAQHQQSHPWNCNGERSNVFPAAAAAGRCSAAYGVPYKLDCSSTPKFSMLDTVREENVNGVPQADKVLLRTKPQSPINPLAVKQTDHASMNRYFSEANLSMQCQMLGAQATCSDILICKEHMPLRYKRESWLKRYGTEEAINCIPPLNQVVELEPDAEPPFERRNVVPRKNKRPEDEFTFGEFLGRGKFGEVKKCTEKKSKKELAAKFVPVRSEIDRSNVYNEVEVMNSLQHPRLLQLYEAFDCGKEIVLIMELISGGELFERVIDDDFILTEMLCEVYVRQICEGIEFMHRENFLHLDMKPENILCINRDGHRIKIIDFGLARKFKPGDTLRILFGTPEFVAPEVVSYEKIGQGTDLWSVGVICYVLLSGLSPFMGDNDAETYNNINHVEYDFDDESFEEISDDAKDFISKLLVLKPENRMTATECLQHPWLTRHSNPEQPRADNVKINTKKLKRFVIRRRWQKAVNVLLALKRMGMSL